MGFFSGLTKTLTGGSDSKTTSSSGFSLLPTQIQSAYNGFADQFSNAIPGATQAFTPLGQTADETNALNLIRQGFAPNASSISSDIAMQINPFDDYVIDGINRQAGGNFSILKQQLDSAGQSGSNRALLGANDIDLTRLQQIGQFKQGQYQQALGNALTTLPSARAQDAQGLLGIGSFERGLDSDQNQAQYKALAQLAQILQVLPSNGGSTSTSTTSQVGGIGPTIASAFSGGAGGTPSAAANFFATLKRS